MDFSKIIPTLSAIAPSIATALGGPLAGMGVSALEDALGIKGDPAALQSAVLTMSPEVAASVRGKDQEFEAKMRGLDIDLEKMKLDADTALAATDERDRESARGRESQIKDWMPKVLGLFVVGGFFALSASVLFGLSTAESALAGTIIGLFANEAKQVITYYFGSTSSSDRKTELLAQSVPATSVTKAP
jgi:hypothetical protein